MALSEHNTDNIQHINDIYSAWFDCQRIILVFDYSKLADDWRPDNINVQQRLESSVRFTLIHRHHNS